MLGIVKHLINKEDKHPYCKLARAAMERLAIIPVTQAEWDMGHINWSRWKSLKFWPTPSTSKSGKGSVCKNYIFCF